MKPLKEIRQELQSLGMGPLGLDEYQSCARLTFRGELVGEARLRFLLLGLFGEVGSLLSELKKKQRDRDAYTAYARSAVEETGDVLWYLAGVADTLGITLSRLAVSLGAGSGTTTFPDLQPQANLFEEPAPGAAVEISLLDLAAKTARVVDRAQDGMEDVEGDLAAVLGAILSAADQGHINLERAATENLAKLLDRWPLRRNWGALYDDGFHEDERIPLRIAVVFKEREVKGTTYAFQSINGVNIGDRLTDNSPVGDDYRFHDVFHLAFAAILGWSPVLRSLLRVKRNTKSQRS